MATETQTIAQPSTVLVGLPHIIRTSSSPEKLNLDLSKYVKLDRAQAGHLRHFHNLAAQIDGEWKHMGAQEPAQEFLDAYRYQLATMAYAAGAAHYHRMPALRSVFKPLIRRLIHKMLRREVWGYWFSTSHSGIMVDPSLKELRHPWADPVKRENIMYSGHLLLMTSLYGMLFDDDEFEKPDSLVFDWNPIFWGMGPETFKYDNRLLQKVITDEMERNGWVGVCCEPNLVFVLIAMRYNDSRDGTNVVDEVLTKYKAAWKTKTMRSESELIHDFYRVKQDDVIPARGIGFTAWANAFMNSWNSETVYKTFPAQSLGYIVGSNDKTVVLNPRTANIFRQLVLEDGASATDLSTLEKAREQAAVSKPPPPGYNQPTFGYICKWLSELGKTAELDSILNYADQNLNPKWEDGGLYYERNDVPVDADGNVTHMDPFTGNSAIGYSRLNVKDGQKKMWEKPWTRQRLASAPWVETQGLESGVDFLRGIWDEEHKAMIVTMRTWNGSSVNMNLRIHGLPEARFAVFVNGQLKEIQGVNKSNGSIDILVALNGEEIDVVIALE